MLINVLHHNRAGGPQVKSRGISTANVSLPSQFLVLSP